MAEFTIVCVAMGQGDCTLIRCPDGKIVVIDCGSTNMDSPKSSKTETFYDPMYYEKAYDLLRTPEWAGGLQGNKVAALILTHPDGDHHNKVSDFFGKKVSTTKRNSDGTPKLVSNAIAIQSVYLSLGTDASPVIEYNHDLKTAINKQTIEIGEINNITINDKDGADNIQRKWKADTTGFIDYKLGINIPIFSNKFIVLSGTTDGVAWSVNIISGNVTHGYKGAVPSSTYKNSASLVTLLEIGNKKALFCGDATFSTEKFLMAAHEDLLKNVDFSSVPHHGSEEASSKVFVDNVNPQACVVSAGFLEHGHKLPRQESIEKWLDCIDNNQKKTGVKITDHNINYWLTKPVDTKETLKQWDTLVVGIRGTNFKYLIVPEANFPIALFSLSPIKPDDCLHYYREATELNSTMTSEGTQLYTLDDKGIHYTGQYKIE